MATRSLLTPSHLPALEEWLTANGWTLLEPKGEYEQLRAKHPDRRHPLLVYTRLGEPQHLSLMDRDVSVIRKFLKERKKK